MSQRIDDAIDVLFAIKQVYETDQTQGIRDIRLQAVKDTAAARGVNPRTIADVYIRRLSPYVKGTGEFDARVGQWLKGHPVELKAALEKCSLDANDQGRIKAFFDANQP